MPTVVPPEADHQGSLHRLGSSLRCRPPADTWARARALMPRLGITRVTDVTRVDRLGLPVFVSVRPRGLALCVHAGKGMDPFDARVGAVMEAIEFAAAEPSRTAWKRRTLTLRALGDDWDDRISAMDLAPRMGPPPAQDRLVDAVLCEDISGGRSEWLPDELVFVPSGERHGDLLFGWSTNGLASGNSLDEATLHALFEVLERDTLAMNSPRDASLLLPHEEMPEPFASLAAKWRRLGVALAVRFVPNEFGLACFRAVLHEGEGATVDLAGGFGLHIDPHIALARAVCEAAQSRLSHIHGGRDDITRFYDRRGDAPQLRGDARESEVYKEAFDATRCIRWHALPAGSGVDASLRGVLDTILQRLAVLGFGRVLRHRFDLDLNGLHVVKVIVPRCQEIDVPWRRLGQRLYERALDHA